MSFSRVLSLELNSRVIFEPELELTSTNHVILKLSLKWQFLNFFGVFFLIILILVN
jgi:hypothetical protein